MQLLIYKTSLKKLLGELRLLFEKYREGKRGIFLCSHNIPMKKIINLFYIE